jgi:4-amino-4-deoxy-L-arabinose transferase-like glycosyltransferase
MSTERSAFTDRPTSHAHDELRSMSAEPVRPGDLEPGKFRVLLALLVAAAAAVRIYWLLTHTAVIENEGGEYAHMAESLLSGKGYVGIMGGPNLIYAPLFSILIAALSLVTHDSELAGRIVSLVAGSLLVLSLSLIALEIYGRRVALICSALVAFHPILVGYSSAVYNEILYSVLSITGIYFVLRAAKSLEIKHCILAGIFFGLAYDTRPEAIAYVFLTGFALIAISLPRQCFKRGLLGVSIVAMAFCLFAGPYVAFLSRHAGHFIVEGKSKLNFTIGTRFNSGMEYNQAAWGIAPDLTEEGPLYKSYAYANYTPYSQSFRDQIRYYLIRAKKNASNLYQNILSAYFFGPFLLFFAAFGLFREAWDPERAIQESVLLLMFTFALMLAISVHLLQFRYSLPLLPLLLVWSSKGIEELSTWVLSTAAQLRLRLSGRWLAGVLQVGAVALTVALPMTMTRYIGDVQEGGARRLALKSAGLWIKNHHPGSKTIMDADVTAIPYYAQATMMVLPYADAPLALRYIHKKSPDFVVLASDTANLRPYITEWLEHGIPDSDATMVYKAGNPPDEQVVVYRWGPPKTLNGTSATR